MNIHRRFKTLIVVLSRRRPLDRIRRTVAAFAKASDRGDIRRATQWSHRLQAWNIYLSPEARLAPDVFFPHPTGIVIGAGCTVEKGVTIYQNVTLGGARRGDWKMGNYPSIGAGTTIFAGAVIVGAVRVGCNCTIGANAVVIHDVPDGATAVGVPARIIARTGHADRAPVPVPGISRDPFPEQSGAGA